jgi:hypothetical protein
MSVKEQRADLQTPNGRNAVHHLRDTHATYRATAGMIVSLAAFAFVAPLALCVSFPLSDAYRDVVGIVHTTNHTTVACVIGLPRRVTV